MSASKSRYDGASFTLQLPTNGGENDAPLKTESRWIKNESSVFDSVCVEMSPLTTGAVYERLQEIMCPKLQKKKTSTNELVFRLEVISATLTWGGKVFPRSPQTRLRYREQWLPLPFAARFVLHNVFFFQSGVCIQTCAFLKKKKNTSDWCYFWYWLQVSYKLVFFPPFRQVPGEQPQSFFPFFNCLWMGAGIQIHSSRGLCRHPTFHTTGIWNSFLSSTAMWWLYSSWVSWRALWLNQHVIWALVVYQTVTVCSTRNI